MNVQVSTARQVAKLTVDDFLLLDRAGAFKGYRKTELINGTIVFVNAQYARHTRAKVKLLRRLADACDALGGGLEAWSEGSINMAPDSMPEPDIFITSAMPLVGTVPCANVVLICEVADSTIRDDLGEMAELYARHGVPEYWVMDLPAGIIHQLWSPSAGGYAERRECVLGERVAATTIAGLGVETDGLV
ncbi:MAG TPA: Uma2 family endonuclease [Sphingomonadaceae bacterium]|jgi:Uma2 family endonuclease|nr:Uma2 family endonuclease [Sphingomonadaceae bacterium]